ncbi:MAG: cisplatin damage response ATP-dependent DNA ligase [Hyphomonadaceae bacterium]|nr:cisplatin damage response ATP-dependent DNA ligase [Hyphomonadaceae bacterium]
MRAFSELLDRLILTPSRNGKLDALVHYFATTPDPDRGYALAAIAGDLSFAYAKPAPIRALAQERVDPVLFDLSRDYVGDMAETIALIWPAKGGANRAPLLSEVVEELQRASKLEAPRLIERWLDGLDANGRWALIKLVTGALRIGAGARLAKQGLAQYGGKPIAEIEEIWHGLAPPYLELFAWLEDRGARPKGRTRAGFRPVMLAHALDESDIAKLDAVDFAAEWKWDGVRVQAIIEGGDKRLYSRTADDISAAFPDLLDHLTFEGAIDGELLVRTANGGVAPFNDLQQRLNRKKVDAKLLQHYPAFIRAYDLLADGAEDLRALPFSERRQRLEQFVQAHGGERLDLSPLVNGGDWETLAQQRAEAPEGVEGLMLKRWDSLYEAGRPKGLWFKWKRDPFTADCVLMYAQRGSGKRSSYYSDYTFGCWRGDELLPVGKAYFGFTDEELRQLDKFVRDHTTDRFGPVRAVRADKTFGLVLEVAFEGIARSTRHKSGVALRFPRIARIRWDKPAREADTLETLERLIG